MPPTVLIPRMFMSARRAEVIARLAGDLACDLIVMGTHGRTGIAELVMGSVASRVLHLAPCPVLLVK